MPRIGNGYRETNHPAMTLFKPEGEGKRFMSPYIIKLDYIQPIVLVSTSKRRLNSIRCASSVGEFPGSGGFCTPVKVFLPATTRTI